MVLVLCSALSEPALGRDVGMAVPFSSPEKGSSGQVRSCPWAGILGFLRERSSEHSFMAWSSPGNAAVREPLGTSDFFSTEQQLQQLSMALDSGSFLGMLLRVQRVSDVLRCNVPHDSHGNHSINWVWKSAPWSKELALKGGTNPPEVICGSLLYSSFAVSQLNSVFFSTQDSCKAGAACADQWQWQIQGF